MKATTEVECPLCGSMIKFGWETTDVPHFGEVMVIAGTCERCGFKHTDTILLTQGEPTRYTFEIREVEDLNVRVIRSTSGTIRLPDLGVDVEPGATSDAYITNVEGVLQKIKGVVSFATRSARDAGAEENARRGDGILECIEKAMEGRYPLTLVLEDPLGNSAIISEDAISSELTDEECESLKTGMIILDGDDG